MEDQDKLKSIWRSVNTAGLPSAAEMVKIMREFRNTKLRKKYVLITALLSLSAFIIGILCVTPFKLFTTYIGGALMATAGIILAVSNIRSLKRFKRLHDCSNDDFLNFLRQTQRNQLYYYKTTQPLLISMHGVGLALYFYEPIVKDAKWFLPVFAACICYVLVMWFVVRPRTYNRGAKKLNATITKIEAITAQLHNS